jgi:hypothetical protein
MNGDTLVGEESSRCGGSSGGRLGETPLLGQLYLRSCMQDGHGLLGQLAKIKTSQASDAVSPGRVPCRRMRSSKSQL